MKKHDCNFYYGKTIFTDLRDGNARMKYCPLCGKLLGTNSPLSIKQLRKSHGKPVYVCCAEFPSLDGWYIVHHDTQTDRMVCWGYDGMKLDSHTYESSWLAYKQEKIGGRRRDL
jgi:hypothetical protein